MRLRDAGLGSVRADAFTRLQGGRPWTRKGVGLGCDLTPIASISGWHWFYFGIAALFAVTGPMWPWLRTRTWLPAVVAASLSRAPLDARLWLAALLLLFLYGTAPEMYHRATAPIAPTADQIAKATSPIQAKLDEAIKQRDTAKLELDDTKRQLDAAPQIAPLGASSSVLIVPSPSLTGPLIGEIASATILFEPGLGEAATLMEKSTNIKTAVVEIDHTVQTTIIGYQPIIGTFVFDGSYGPFDVRVGGGSVFPADTTTIRENGETSVVVQIFPGQALTTIGSSSREIRISFLRK